MTVDRPGKPRTLYRVDLETREFKPIVEADTARYAPAISALAPDDKTLYMGAHNPENARVTDRIVAVDLTTRERRQIFQAPSSDRPPIFFRLSPDGRTLAIRRRDPADRKTHFGVVSVDGSGYRELHATKQGGAWDVLAWARDGQSLLFGDYEDEQRWRIMRLPLNGGPLEATGVQGTGQLQTLDVSPDGGRIAFSTGRNVTELWALDNLSSVLQ